MIKKLDKNAERQKRHTRVRGKISGTPERPRLNVYRSTNHIYAQVIDDVAGKTIVSASTMEAGVRGKMEGTKTQQAQAIGKTVAQRALDAGIKDVVFDRGGYLYTGRVAAVAQAAREAGLNF